MDGRSLEMRRDGGGRGRGKGGEEREREKYQCKPPNLKEMNL